MIRIAAPALIVMTVVVALVALAGWNRSGDPRLIVTLTERELPAEGSVQPPEEDPNRRLRIHTDFRGDPLDALNWLPQARLGAIGFSFHVPAGAPEAADTYSKMPARLAWVAFELGGPAWRDIERRRAVERGPEPMRESGLDSRLVAVDAGPDFDALHAKYPGGHLILRAVIAVTYLPPERGGPFVYGAVRQIVPSHISVPARLRPILDALSPRRQVTDPVAPAAAPRYEADVAIGKLGLPYLLGLRPMQTAALLPLH